MASPTTGTNRARWPILVGFLIALGVLSAAIGWGLSGLITSQRPAPSSADDALSADQAREQACNAYRVASRQWVKAYREWLPTVSAPGWQWHDPTVQEATARLSEREAEIVAQLDSLIAPTTPMDVAQAIRGYTGALLEYSAGHGTKTDPQMDEQENQIDDAADEVARVCY